MKGLALDSGEFISADELNARWLPRKATEEEMIEKQPEAMQLPTLPFAVFDEFGQPCEDRVRDHFAAAFEALRAQIGQGVPDGWQQLLRAANEVLSWTDSRNRPPVRDRFECGRMAHVRVHALADLNDAVSAIKLDPTAPQQKPLTDEQIDDARVMTVVYRNVQMADVQSFMDHPKAVWFGWCHAPYQRDHALYKLNKAVAAKKPLTDEQINQMWSDAHNDTSPMSLIHVFARAIEATNNIGEKK